MGSLEVAVTYVMTPKVNLTIDLDLGYDPKRSCSFFVMLTKALHRVIRENGHNLKTTEPILKIFTATDSATMVSG